MAHLSRAHSAEADSLSLFFLLFFFCRFQQCQDLPFCLQASGSVPSRLCSVRPFCVGAAGERADPPPRRGIAISRSVRRERKKRDALAGATCT
ncbi:hypothetical protein Efla_004415 [Eimeria flavescens]